MHFLGKRTDDAGLQPFARGTVAPAGLPAPGVPRGRGGVQMGRGTVPWQKAEVQNQFTVKDHLSLNELLEGDLNHCGGGGIQ